MSANRMAACLVEAGDTANVKDIDKDCDAGCKKLALRTNDPDCKRPGAMSPLKNSCTFFPSDWT